MLDLIYAHYISASVFAAESNIYLTLEQWCEIEVSIFRSSTYRKQLL